MMQLQREIPFGKPDVDLAAYAAHSVKKMMHDVETRIIPWWPVRTPEVPLVKRVTFACGVLVGVLFAVGSVLQMVR